MQTLRRSLLVIVAAFILCSASVHAQEADLLIEKFGPPTANAGDDVSFDVNIANGGPDGAVNVTLNDSVPPGMTFVSATQLTGPTFVCTTPTVGDTSGAITCTIAGLAAGQAATFTFVFNIPSGTPPGTTFTNIATVSSETFDPNDENNSAPAATSTPFPPEGNLAVEKTGPTSAAAGDDVTYTITFQNLGPDAAADVTLTDTLPGTMTFVSLTHDSTLSCTTPAVGAGGTISCSGASMPGSTTWTFTLTGNVPSDTPSGMTFENTVTVGASNDPDGDNNSSTHILTIAESDISVVKSGPPTADAGTDISYTITLTNNGPDSASGAFISDELPEGTTFVSITNPPATFCETPPPGGTGTVACSTAFLPSGNSLVFTLVIHVEDATLVQNTVVAGSDNADGDPSDNSSTATTTIIPIADLDVTKSGPATATAGTNITYTVTLENLGPSDAADVSLTDDVPANTTFVSATQTSGPTFNCTTPPSGGTGTITCTIASFEADATATFEFEMLVLPGTATGSTISNTANVSSTTSDPDSGNNTSNTTTATDAVADLTVEKDGPNTVMAGATVTFEIVVSNSGPSDAVSVTLEDVLPANTTFASLTQTTGPTFACTTPAPGTNGTVTCTIATFAAGANATFSLVLNVDPQATGSVDNTVTVTSPSDTSPTNNSSTSSAAIGLAGVPSLSPLGLALLALSLAGIVLIVLRR